MPTFSDRVKETTTTTGTGDITLAGAVAQFVAFSPAFATNERFFYTIVGQTGTEWETGLGYLSGATTLVRASVLASSNAGNAVNFSAGTKDVFCSVLADSQFRQRPALPAFAGTQTYNSNQGVCYPSFGGALYFTNASMTAGRLYLMPFFAPYPKRSVNKVIVRTAGTVVSTTLRCGLYRSADGALSATPNGAPLFDTSFNTGSVSGVLSNTLGSPVPLEPQALYWAALLCDGGVSIYGLQGSYLSPVGLNVYGCQSTAPATAINCVYKPGVSIASLPSSPVPDAILAAGNNFPLFFMEFV